jgi:TRAP-type C4-dicarboxylate transport system permease small subunit
VNPGPVRSALLAFVDFVKLAFLGLLAFISWTITERMHQQRMTVFDLPMSYVYAGVAFGCFLMFFRQAINVWRNARAGWRRPDDITHQIAPD